MKTRTCRNCIYFYACGDVNRTEPCDGRFEITKAQAQEFYRDLCGTVNENSKTCQGTLSVEKIADRMEISIEKANEFCNAMIKYGITERQGGAIVV